MAESTISQGDFNCRASSQADFILNYFLSNVLKCPQISSNFLKFPQISSQILHFLQAGWEAGTIKAALVILSIWGG